MTTVTAHPVERPVPARSIGLRGYGICLWASPSASC